MKTRECKICKQSKIEEDFVQCKKSIRHYCKKCHCEQQTARYNNFTEERRKKLQEEATIRRLKKSIKLSSNDTPLELKITDWVKRIFCVKSRLPNTSLSIDSMIKKCFLAFEKYPKINFGYFSKNTNSREWIASLDKIDPNKFYTDDNVQVIPMWLNSAKLKFTQDELDSAIIDYIMANKHLKEKIIYEKEKEK